MKQTAANYYLYPALFLSYSLIGMEEYHTNQKVRRETVIKADSSEKRVLYPTLTEKKPNPTAVALKKKKEEREENNFRREKTMRIKKDDRPFLDQFISLMILNNNGNTMQHADRYRLDLSNEDEYCKITDIKQVEQLMQIKIMYNPQAEQRLQNRTLRLFFKLKDLNLSHNALPSLPPEIEQLIDLEKLNLDHNQLESLPKRFKKLKQLKKLILTNNPIKTLPDLEHLELTEFSISADKQYCFANFKIFKDHLSLEKMPFTILTNENEKPNPNEST